MFLHSSLSYPLYIKDFSDQDQRKHKSIEINIFRKEFDSYDHLEKHQ